MIKATQEFINAMLSPVTEVYVKLELLDKNDEVIDVITQHVNANTTGDISIDADRDIRRMFTLKLDNSDGKYTWMENSLIWIDKKKVKLYIGLKTASGEIEYVPEGVFVITQPEATHKPKENTVTISGQDKMYFLLGNLGRFNKIITIPKGTNIKTAIKTIAEGAGINKMILEDTDAVVPYDMTYQIGQNRGKAIKELAKLAIYDIYFDTNGYLRFEPFKDPEKDPACWTYEIEDNTLYAGSIRKLDDSKLFNHILVMGGSSQTAEFRREIIIDEENAIKPYFYIYDDEEDFNTGTLSNLEINQWGYLKLIDSQTVGNFTSPIIDISTSETVDSSEIFWIADSYNQTIEIEINLSFDGGTTWDGWIPIANGEEFISAGTDLSNARLQFRINLSTTDNTISPIFKSMNIRIDVEDTSWVGHPYSIQKIGDRFYAWNNGNPDPIIDSQEQCNRRAEFELKKNLIYAEKISVDLAPNYLHEANDIIEIEDKNNGTIGKYQLKQFTIPIKPKIITAEAQRINEILMEGD